MTTDSEAEFLSKGKILIRMRLEFGETLELKEEVEWAAADQVRPQSHYFADFHPIPGWDRWVPEDGAPVKEQKIERSLERTNRRFALRDQGLAQSYFIFGAPNMGKTNLLMHLLKQLLTHERDRSSHKFGALIIDPKNTLGPDLERLIDLVGRRADFRRIDAQGLKKAPKKDWVNIIDTRLPSKTLGLAIVKAAKAAGMELSDGFWLLAGENLLGATDALLRTVRNEVPTLSTLIDTALGFDGVPKVSHLINEAKAFIKTSELSTDVQGEIQLNIDRIRQILAKTTSEGDRTYNTIRIALTNVLDDFLRPEHEWYSASYAPGERPRIYDEIINEGKIFFVSPTAGEAKINPILSSVIKTLFQDTVLNRDAWVREGKLRNFSRPLLLMIDEYSDVAAQQRDSPWGDLYFVQKARAPGCLGLFATQSVALLEQSRGFKGETHEALAKALLSVAAGLFVMRVGDPRTEEALQKRAGKHDVIVKTMAVTRGSTGKTVNEQFQKKEEEVVPSGVVSQLLALGQGVFAGTTDGKIPDLQYVQTPKWD